VERCWLVVESTLNNEGLLGGRLGDFLLFFMQLRVDDH
jgi:hypothetical protein